MAFILRHEFTPKEYVLKKGLINWFLGNKERIETPIVTHYVSKELTGDVYCVGLVPDRESAATFTKDSDYHGIEIFIYHFNGTFYKEEV